MYIIIANLWKITNWITLM